MTPDQVRMVQESFKLVLPIRDEAAALFYGRLFEIDPSTRKLFAATDMKSQGGKLMAAIAMVVHALHAPEPMLGKVKALAGRHVAYGVEEAHYATVGAALIWTLEAGLGAAFTPALREAWTAAYTLLATVMIEAAREATAVAKADSFSHKGRSGRALSEVVADPVLQVAAAGLGVGEAAEDGFR